MREQLPVHILLFTHLLCDEDLKILQTVSPLPQLSSLSSLPPSGSGRGQSSSPSYLNSQITGLRTHRERKSSLQSEMYPNIFPLHLIRATDIRARSMFGQPGHKKRALCALFSAGNMKSCADARRRRFGDEKEETTVPLAHNCTTTLLKNEKNRIGDENCKMFHRYMQIAVREGIQKKTIFLGLSPKLWVGGGQES